LRQINRSCKKNRQAFATTATNHTPSLVGAGSTREGRAAVCQIRRAEPFAGRAGSHSDRWQPLVGAGSTREDHTAVQQIQRAKPFAGRAGSHSDRWQRLVGAGSTRESRAAVHQIHRAKPFAAEPAPTGIDGSPCGSGFYPRRSRCGLPDTMWRILRGQSPLPQESMAAPVGAGSIRESHTAVLQLQRAKSFAGRARSHRDRWQSLWERVLPAKAALRSTRYTAPNPSRAEPAPTGLMAPSCGSGFYPRRLHRGSAGTTRRILRRRSPLPQGYLLPREAAAPPREQLDWMISGTGLPRWSR